jgi:hypothetical protein
VRAQTCLQDDHLLKKDRAAANKATLSALATGLFVLVVAVLIFALKS